MSIVTLPNGWIRPWYPCGTVGHLFPDCLDLLAWDADPQPGAGWLDPHIGEVCQPCVERHSEALAEEIFPQPEWDAVCDTCDWSLGQSDDDLTEDNAMWFMSHHQCEPDVRVVRPPVIPPKRTADPVGRIALLEAS